MTGIALAGWDRTGWGRPDALADHWMRMRDRRAPLAVLVLAVAYLALLLWPVTIGLHWLRAAPGGGWRLADWMLMMTMGLLCWRLAMRVACTARCYGWRQAFWAAPRLFIGNVVSLIAAPRALYRYFKLLRGAPPVWDKTLHVFPDDDVPLAA